jgi:hypothetical protein
MAFNTIVLKDSFKRTLYGRPASKSFLEFIRIPMNQREQSQIVVRFKINDSTVGGFRAFTLFGGFLALNSKPTAKLDTFWFYVTPVSIRNTTWTDRSAFVIKALDCRIRI